MARKPRMGRNLNALLNSAVKERREQSDTARAPNEERTAETSGDATSSEPSNVGTANNPVDLAVVRLPSGGTGRGPDAPRRQGADDSADGLSDERAGAPGGGSANGEAARSANRSTGEAGDARQDDATSGEGGGGEQSGNGSVSAHPGTATHAATDTDAHVTRVVASVPTSPAAAGEADEVAPGDPPRPGDRLRMIGVERIRRGVFQPRRFFDQEALQELADSLRAQGMIQPVVVRPIGDVFELIAGERRWRAAQIAGLAEIPAIVREMEDRSVAAVSLIENIQREDLNPLEEAQALMRLCDEFGMTHASVAESIGRSRAAVSNLMRLLELHDDVKAMVDKGELDMGHARALLRVPTVDQPALAARVAKQGLTVRAVEKLIRTGADKAAASDASKSAAELDPDVERLIERLSGVLGAPVSIRHKPGGAGKLEIRYGSLDELDGILAHIR